MCDTTIEKTVLLLVGRTGNGKSSIGNNILGGDNVFKIKQYGDESEEKECMSKTFEYQGQSVTIVDGVSIHDTDYENDTCINKNVEECLLKCGNYVTAFLITLRFGFRFTRQEKQAIELIKTLFGSRSIKNYGIIVLTYGDNFDQDISMDEWLNEQTGDIKNVLEEVNYRCVLFNNKHDHDPQQVKQLLDSVETVRKHKPYERGLFLMHDKMKEMKSYRKRYDELHSDDLKLKKFDKSEIKKSIDKSKSLLKEIEVFKKQVNLIGDTNKMIHIEAKKDTDDISNHKHDDTIKDESGNLNNAEKNNIIIGDDCDTNNAQKDGITKVESDDTINAQKDDITEGESDDTNNAQKDDITEGESANYAQKDDITEGESDGANYAQKDDITEGESDGANNAQKVDITEGYTSNERKDNINKVDNGDTYDSQNDFNQDFKNLNELIMKETKLLKQDILSTIAELERFRETKENISKKIKKNFFSSHKSTENVHMLNSK